MSLDKTYKESKNRISRIGITVTLESSIKKHKTMCRRYYIKRYGNIYKDVYDMDNLKVAHQRARKDKSYYKEVKMVDSNENHYLRKIQNMLKNKTYFVGEGDYTMFEKKDKNKIRQIYKLDYFPHRIIQHALLLQVEEVFLKNLISNTFSSIPNRGIHLAFQRLNSDLRNHKNETKYCLQVDIEKFYPSVNHEINKLQHRRKFKDDDLLWLIFMLIDSLGGDCGIAIGSLFSQWNGNFNLSELDHWLKETKRIRFYYRYCDDLIILCDNKKDLHIIRKDIQDYLHTNLKLKMKNNYKVFPVDEQGIDFVGYRHFRDYVLLRNTTKKSLIRKMRDISNKIDKGKPFLYADFCSINSYKG